MAELAALSVRLAQQAIAEEDAAGLVAVAASVPPLHESYQAASKVIAPDQIRYGPAPGQAPVHVGARRACTCACTHPCAGAVLAAHILEPPARARTRKQYVELVGGLAGADIFLCETMASVRDARAVWDWHL